MTHQTLTPYPKHLQLDLKFNLSHLNERMQPGQISTKTKALDDIKVRIEALECEAAHHDHKLYPTLDRLIDIHKEISSCYRNDINWLDHWNYDPDRQSEIRNAFGMAALVESSNRLLHTI